MHAHVHAHVHVHVRVHVTRACGAERESIPEGALCTPLSQALQALAAQLQKDNPGHATLDAGREQFFQLRRWLRSK